MLVTRDSYIKLRHAMESVQQKKNQQFGNLTWRRIYAWSCLWECLQTDEDAVHLRDRHTVTLLIQMFRKPDFPSSYYSSFK